MSIWTNPVALSLRRLGRAVGVNRMIGMALRRAGYEERFGEALLRRVKPGDCVWDVGANIGVYTDKFAEIVGPLGEVIAFEPSPVNRKVLERRLARRDNVSILPFALGGRNESAALAQGADDIGATSQIVDPARAGEERTMRIEVRTGDELLRKRIARAPNVIKIDTEGYELDILEGMSAALGDRRLRAVGVEVHFALLARGGRGNAPSRIESLLESSGYRLRWTDTSHVLATRTPGPVAC